MFVLDIWQGFEYTSAISEWDEKLYKNETIGVKPHVGKPMSKLLYSLRDTYLWSFKTNISNSIRKAHSCRLS